MGGGAAAVTWEGLCAAGGAHPGGGAAALRQLRGLRAADGGQPAAVQPHPAQREEVPGEGGLPGGGRRAAWGR